MDESPLTKGERIDLGLAIMAAMAEPGTCYTHEQIGNFAGCTGNAIRNIEARALKKLARALQKQGFSIADLHRPDERLPSGPGRNAALAN